MRVFSALVFLIALFAMLYAYLIGSSVFHVALRAEVEKEIAHISMRLSDLEKAYLKRKGAIDREYARTLGFHEVSEKTYLTRASALSERVTLNDGG